MRITPDSKIALVYGGLEYNSVVRRTDDDSPRIKTLRQAVLASQLISNQRIENNVPIKMKTSEWYSAWKRFKEQ